MSRQSKHFEVVRNWKAQLREAVATCEKDLLCVREATEVTIAVGGAVAKVNDLTRSERRISTALDVR